MIYVLMLNDMRSAKSEYSRPVAWSDNKETLLRLLEEERCASYQEPGFNCYGETVYGKSFKKNGVLEWFNPPSGPSEGIVQINGYVENEVPMYHPEPIYQLQSILKL